MNLQSVKMVSGFYTKEEQDNLLKANDEIHFQSRMGFLNSHNGLRRKKMHLFIAPTGVGKSTFVRTIIGDTLKHNPKAVIFVWLTEETSEEFKTQISYFLPSHDILEQIIIFSEQDNVHMSDENLYEVFEDVAETINPDIFICDNITTSKLYQPKKLHEQGKFCDHFKHYAVKNNLVMFFIAHTGADIKENQTRLIDENDIRGNKYITTITEFLYILQPVWVNQQLHQFLKIKKHRGQDIKHSLYYLQYNKHLKVFGDDLAKDYEEFKKIFAMRNKLS